MPFFTTHRNQIIQIFKLSYYFLLIFTGFGFWAIYTGQSYQLQIYSLGRLMGQASVLTFVLVLLPGIAQRFQIYFAIFNLLRLFRRYLGILMYLLVLAHSTLVYTVFVIQSGQIPANLPLYTISGLVASWLLLPLFLTSNDKSVRMLGPWWGRLHKLVYVIVWLAFAHIALQHWNIWSIIIGITAVLETISLVWKAIQSSRPPRLKSKITEVAETQ